MSNLIIAPIILPAVLAGLLVILRPSIGLQRIISGAGALALCVIAVMLAAQADTPRAYFLGNWPAPLALP